MPCPECGGFMKRTKSKRFSFEDAKHELKRMICSKCKKTFFWDGKSYKPSTMDVDINTKDA